MATVRISQHVLEYLDTRAISVIETQHVVEAIVIPPIPVVIPQHVVEYIPQSALPVVLIQHVIEYIPIPTTILPPGCPLGDPAAAVPRDACVQSDF